MFFYIAFFLYLTSATGLILSGVRMSDISFAALVVLSIFPLLKKSSKSIFNIRIFYLFLLILISIILSTIINFDSIILSDSQNFIQIPLSIFTALLILFSLKENSLSALLINYSKITVLLSLFFYIIYTANIYDLGLDLLLESGDRFSGLSKNPNQLALYLLPIPFFALHFYIKNEINFFSMVWIFSGALFVNYLVIGKALFLSWSFGLIVIYTLTGLTIFNKVVNFKNMYFRLFVLILTIPFFSKVLEKLYTGDGRGSQEGQGEIRLLLWGNGLRAGFDSLFFGHGPGHYSGVLQPYEGMEAHNFYIDWFSAYGLFGLFSLLFLITYILSRTLVSRNVVMLGLLSAILFQISFHFYGRQPFFWIVLITIFQFSSSSDRGEK